VFTNSFFDQNWEKVGKWSLFCLLFQLLKFFSNAFEIWEKHFKPNFPIKVWKSNAFSQILFILHAKNSNAPFFGPEEVIFCKLYFNFLSNFLQDQGSG